MLRQALKLTDVVVLPTPPFWLAIAIIFPLLHLLSRNFLLYSILSNFIRKMDDILVTKEKLLQICESLNKIVYYYFFLGILTVI